MGGLPGGVDHRFSPVEFEEGGEACSSSAFVQWGPLQLVVHFTDTGGLSMAVDHPACRPSLHSLNFADVLGGVQVPDTASVFQNCADKCFVRLMFGVNGPDLQCPSQEVECLVGFVDHVHDVGVPTQVFRNGDSQVLNLPGVVEGVAVKLRCSCSLRLSPCACAVVSYVVKTNAWYFLKLSSSAASTW